MNPFDLPGPAFLALYLGLFGVAYIVAYLHKEALVAKKNRPARLTDAYAVARLRGGRKEAARLAIARLIHLERFSFAGSPASPGLLRTALSGSSLVPGSATTPPEHPLERALDVTVRLARHAVAPTTLERAPAVAEALGQLEDTLRKQELLLDRASHHRVKMARLWLTFALMAFGLIKLGVALDRDHHNVLFLVLLIGLTPWALFRRTFDPPTTYGATRTLAGLSSMLAHARTAPPTSPEALFIAATLGATAAGWAPTLALAFPPPPTIGSHAGSSCSSSSCGSGCGGGCGGCGS